MWVWNIFLGILTTVTAGREPRYIAFRTTTNGGAVAGIHSKLRHTHCLPQDCVRRDSGRAPENYLGGLNSEVPALPNLVQRSAWMTPSMPCRACHSNWSLGGFLHASKGRKG